MHKGSIPAVALLVLVVTLAAGTSPAAGSDPGMRHTVFMAGSVIEASAEGIYLCIGTPEGAAVGQQLDVVRLTRDKGGNPKQAARFKREKVGAVRIDAIVDEHFAQATLLSGGAEKGDIVRLEEPNKDAAKP